MLFVVVWQIFFARALAQDVSVWTKDPAWARSAYKGKNVQFEDAKLIEDDHKNDGYLYPDKRDAVIEKAGMTAAVAKMDNVDKDLLIETTHVCAVNELKKYYPKFKTDDLARLKVAVDAELAK